ncbi:MAG: 4-hydroxy-tetrahydrodipicolinate synthase, partial [Candidatus Electryonea clarkiae]|nr:4-hydroxy-tetrahydrodipicolinate synthase [Candidatus Electryonea clarkiae]
MTDWKGVFTALVTPFNEDDSLDEDGLRSLIQRQLDAGIHGLVPCGTTGESPALNQAEWERVIEITVAEAKGKATIIAGSGTNNTTVSAERTKRVGELGADGALVITPYYNKPTEDGIVRHFVAIVEAAPDVPIMVYNVPGRTALNLTPATLERLMDLPTIAAVKEASGSLAQVWEIVKLIVGNAVLFSGEDGLNLPIWDVGGVGTVSVLSNLVPELVVEQWKAKMEGYSADAYDLHRRLDRLVKAIFIETSPAPVKYALKLMGLPGGNVRPPLAPMRFESQDAVKQEL